MATSSREKVTTWGAGYLNCGLSLTTPINVMLGGRAMLWGASEPDESATNGVLYHADFLAERDKDDQGATEMTIEHSPSSHLLTFTFYLRVMYVTILVGDETG